MRVFTVGEKVEDKSWMYNTDALKKMANFRCDRFCLDVSCDECKFFDKTCDSGCRIHAVRDVAQKILNVNKTVVAIDGGFRELVERKS